VEAREAKYLNKSSTAEGAEKRIRNLEFMIINSAISASPAVNWEFNKFFGGDNASNLA
jgi:hypothetical protein